MKKLTLSWRLGIAFGALILLMVALGSVAVWRITMASTMATDVAEAHTPEVMVAHDINTAAWETRFYIRSYSLDGDDVYLRKGRKALTTVREHLKAADALGKKFPAHLAALRQGTLEATEKTNDFESLVDQVEAEYKNMASQRAELDDAASQYMQACLALRALEKQKMDAELAEKADLAKLTERLAKMGMVEDIIDLGNTIRINNFKYQSTKDMDALREDLKNFDALDKAVVSLESVVETQASKEQIAKLRKAADKYKAVMEKVLKSQLAINAFIRELYDAGNAVTTKAGVVAENGLRENEKVAADVADGLSLTSLILLVGLGVALAAGILIAWLSTRAITGPIREGVNVLASTATEISATVSQLASNASETAAAVAETTTTVDEVRQTAQVAVDKAKAVADSAQGASRAAEAGRQATDQALAGLNRIREQMGAIGGSITRLSEQSQAVGDIVATVADLAEQSNLLAVNASIEAAKAGEQGKGFSVVAQEIRSLAEQSKDSTKQVRAILTEVQKATGKAVMAAEQGSQGVADGGKQADQAGQAIQTLTATVQEATRASMLIAASSQQQLIGVEQVGRAMENIKQATTQNAEGARQLETAAHNLQQVGIRLKALVDAEG
jgi:methyl-accepting chemotaxis protein